MEDEAVNVFKTKYMLMYAKDVKVAPQPGNTEIKEFRTKLGFVWFLICNKSPRDAINAGRFQFITVKR